MPIEFRSIDGSGNNLANPDFGQADTQLLRLTSPEYEDGLSEPRGGFNSSSLNPRDISNIVLDQADTTSGNQLDVSDWFWAFGQFLDHDLDLSEPGEPAEPFNIPVPAGDPDFDPGNTGTQIIPLNRAIFDPNTGTSNPRQQLNELTAFIDGSQVYGSDQELATDLRANDGTGKLRTSISSTGEVLLPVEADGSFLAGDIRVDEHIGLTSVHTLFLREHNRLADDIGNRLNSDAALNQLFIDSGLGEGDFIYEAARMVVGAEIQAITYNEFLPLLVGDNAISNYTGYDPTVNPGIANEFSTAAFRFGHTMLSPQLLRYDGSATEEIALRDTFFNPEAVKSDGVDSLLLGLSQQEAQDLDGRLVDEIRNFLFGAPGQGGLDLGSLNIQRGRDHGLLNYTDFRKEFLGNNGLGRLSNEDRGRIRDAYPRNNIRNIDLWVGGISERDQPGALVGETFEAIIADQFTRLRDGDRFFYQDEDQLAYLNTIYNGTGNGDQPIENVDLSSIIEANIADSLSGIVPPDPFMA